MMVTTQNNSAIGCIKMFVAMALMAPFAVSALTVSEVMFDPLGSDTGREWIEIFNEGEKSVKVTDIKLFESGTNHGISTYQGNEVLDARAYAVIADNAAKFLADYPDYKGQLFDSAFSLVQSGESIALKLGTNVLHEVVYDVKVGGNDDGSTVILEQGIWVRGSATPGAVNIPEEKSAVNTKVTEGSQILTTLAAPVSLAPDLVVQTEGKVIVMAGLPYDFNARSFDRAGKSVAATYVWSFGDGGTRATGSLPYTYIYPGNYLARVESKTSSSLASAYVDVRVVAADVVIVDIVSDSRGGYVVIKNSNKDIVQIGGIKVITTNGVGVVPYGTLINGNSGTRFSLKEMGLMLATGTIVNSANLAYPNGEFLYGWSRLASSTSANSNDLSFTSSSSTKYLAVKSAAESKNSKVRVSINTLPLDNSKVTTKEAYKAVPVAIIPPKSTSTLQLITTKSTSSLVETFLSYWRK